MKTRCMLLACLSAGVVCAAGVDGVLDAPVLATGSGRVLLLSPQGEVVWEHKAGNIHDAWRLPNGHVLFADGAVTEVAPDHTVVFRYVPENQTGGGAFSCQRLPNGHTLVGENASGRVVEVDPAGRVVFSLMTRFESKNDHHHMRMARKLANGNYLVCHSGDNMVREYRPDGTTAWEQRTPSLAFAAVRLPNGNTLVSAIDRLIEYASDGQEVWSFAKDDVPGVMIQNMTGFHVLPNSNLVVGCYAAYTKEGQGTGLFEITRAKQLVWRYASPGLRDKNMMGVQKLVAADETPLR